MYDTSLQDNQKEKQATGSLYNYPTALSTNTVKLFVSAKFSLFMKMKMVKPKTVSAAPNTHLQNKSAFIFENAQSFSSSQLTEREEMPAGGERRGKGS